MRRAARPRQDHGNGRVTDEVFEEELRPGLRVEIGSPFRKGLVARALEERANAEREVCDDADLPFLRERQDARYDAVVGSAPDAIGRRALSGCSRSLVRSAASLTR